MLSCLKLIWHLALKLSGMFILLPASAWLEEKPEGATGQKQLLSLPLCLLIVALSFSVCSPRCIPSQQVRQGNQLTDDSPDASCHVDLDRTNKSRNQLSPCFGQETTSSHLVYDKQQKGSYPPFCIKIKPQTQLHSMQRGQDSSICYS